MSLVRRSPTCPLYRGSILEVLNAIGIEMFGSRALSFVERSTHHVPTSEGPLPEVPLYYTYVFTGPCITLLTSVSLDVESSRV